jgi:hypothetical protein
MVYNTQTYWGFGLHPHMAVTVEGKIISQHEVLQLIVCIGFHGRGLLYKISTSFSTLVSALCMLYHNFYRHIFVSSPIYKA